MTDATTAAAPRRRQKLMDFLGLRRSMVGLLGMVVLVGLGERMGERFLPLYLQQLAGGATAIFAIGLLAGMDDLLSALYSFPGGYLSDRLGTKQARCWRGPRCSSPDRPSRCRRPWNWWPASSPRTSGRWASRSTR